LLLLIFQGNPVSHKVLIIGPKPPAIGGIASIVSLLHTHLSDIEILDSAKPSDRLAKVVHPIVLMLRILFYCLTHSRCKVLFFSSAYRSFWEKSCWALIGRLCRAEVFVVMVDGNFPEFYAGISNRKKWLARYFMTGVTVVAQSPSWKLFFQGVFPSSKLDTIIGGIDVDFFQPEVNRQSPHILNVLYVGWIIKEKGVHDILAACHELKEKVINFKVDLVGPIYCDRVELEQLIKQYQLENVVTIVGAIHSREALRAKYSSSDVFLFPSHYEGFPMALLEALACGLPSIGTNVGGIPDILDHGNCGLIIESRNPKDISNALQRLLTDEQLRIELKVKSRERAVNEFSISSSVGSYKTLLGLAKD
tara:strand:- start:15833 stop:16924 length:1092 start_codon:yes stop_codon:yes gene_type:complete